MSKLIAIVALLLATATPMLAQYQTASFYGTWVCQTIELGQVVTLHVTYRADKTFTFSASTGVSLNGTWRYEDPNIYEKINEKTKEMYAAIQWNSPNEFVLKIIDNGYPAYEGTERTYQRMDNSAFNRKEDLSGYWIGYEELTFNGNVLLTSYGVHVLYPDGTGEQYTAIVRNNNQTSLFRTAFSWDCRNNQFLYKRPALQLTVQLNKLSHGYLTNYRVWDSQLGNYAGNAMGKYSSGGSYWGRIDATAFERIKTYLVNQKYDNYEH